MLVSLASAFVMFLKYNMVIISLLISFCTASLSPAILVSSGSRNIICFLIQVKC